ncbi:SDR family oxidoreductase [Chelativorans sp. AA-79]|uniref:SDR family oxidoreductase n=1 Tax=Chelativorans sp. AA-79 TaxID=3028735 RepID=UPI0023FA2734|nr:SDR family oxidoreductase [Chelativorans sp. AA-79]WEX08999.1 SDR family oxidoreductase [Chelativorans sp. AA-79]
MGRLDQRLIAITGAAQGIGLAIARDFASEGADLLLLDIDRTALESAARDIRAANPERRIDAEVCDIAVPEQVAGVFAEKGAFDGLVNNAGVNVFHDPLETSQAEWRRAFAINLEGAWACCRAVLPAMIERRHGVILNIASTHSFTIIPGTFPYPVVKHALMGLTKSLGLEYASRGIRVNAIAPGYVATQKVLDWWDAAPDPAAAKVETMALHPQGRIASPEEIARAAVFMISDECPFMTATCLTIDGGLSVRQHG